MGLRKEHREPVLSSYMRESQEEMCPEGDKKGAAKDCSQPAGKGHGKRRLEPNRERNG